MWVKIRLRGGITSTNTAVTLLGSGQFQGGGDLGSLEGTGLVDLQQGSIIVGHNNRSTVFSGQFTNGPGGGELLKVGAGSLTLNGSALGGFFLVVRACPKNTILGCCIRRS